MAHMNSLTHFWYFPLRAELAFLKRGSIFLEYHSEAVFHQVLLKKDDKINVQLRFFVLYFPKWFDSRTSSDGTCHLSSCHLSMLLQNKKLNTSIYDPSHTFEVLTSRNNSAESINQDATLESTQSHYTICPDEQLGIRPCRPSIREHYPFHQQVIGR